MKLLREAMELTFVVVLLYGLGILNIASFQNLTWIATSIGLCPITGNGRITMDYAAILNCDGELTIGSSMARFRFSALF